MKKCFLIAILIATVLIFPALCEENEDTFCSMRVCNCNEWVSLRAEPDTKSERLLKVPLGNIVDNCAPAGDRFTYCEYDGQTGYILTEYLEPVEDNDFEIDVETDFSPVEGLTLSEMFADENATVIFEEGGEKVVYRRRYPEDGETLTVGRFDATGTAVWAYSTYSSVTTELDMTEAFMAGTDWDRTVMIYNTHIGLTAVDAETGEIRWTLSREQVSLGASITYAVDDFGSMYICGYYGPDPVAIGADGTLLWASSVENPDVFWPYEIRVVEGGIVVCYDSLSQTSVNGHYEAFIGFGGKVEWITVRA